MNKDGFSAASSKIVKTAARRWKKLMFWGIVLVLLGRCAYNNVSLPSDWVLYETLVREAEKNPGKTIRLTLKDIYPGEWQKVCFYGRYQGREEILRRDGIDIAPTRARVWAGSESAMTFLFIYADGTIYAQRVTDGLDFASMLSSGHPALKLPSCGNRDSEIEMEAQTPKPYPYTKFDLVFYPSQGDKS